MPTFNPTNQTGKTGTIQTWTVPFTANWIIEVWGAQGSGDLGGFGAHLKATIALTAGQQLKILVGQQGVLGSWQQGAGQGAGGGGGGTFVTLSDNTPLVVAGGGGGGGLTGSAIHGTVPANVNASISTSGRNDTTNTNTGGASGAGGGSSASTATYSGAGGGGLTGNGTSGTHTVRETDTYGRSFTNGGQGGSGGTAGGGTPGYGGDGGFGGGGGGTYSCGGGGGYSGGAGKHQSVGTEVERRAGGGGGSFITASGTNTLLEIGNRIGAGLVIITPGTPPTLSNLFSGSVNPLTNSIITWTYADAESNPQESYEIGWRKQGSGESHNFIQYDSSNAYHTIPAGTLEEGATYDWALRVKDSNGLWSNYATSQFTSISPYRIETVVNLATETPNGQSTGQATVTNNYSWGGSSWTRIQPLAAGHNGRFYVPLNHLVDGKTYTLSATIANITAAPLTINADWCDSAIQNYTLAANEVRRITFNSSRSTYTSIYRFLDFTAAVGSDFLVKDIVIAPGANKSPVYFNGDSTANNAKHYWLGTPGASPSVKEVFAYENWAQDPRATNTATGFGRFTADRWGGNTSYSWVTGATDGPLGIPTYLRATVTSGRTALGFHLAGNPETTTSYQSVPVQPGETINVSNYIRSSVATNWQVAIRFANVSNQWIDTFTGNSMAVAANTWTRVHHERVVPAEAAWASAYVVAPASLPTGATFDGTGLQITKSSISRYFDGSYKEGNGKPNLFTNPSAETDLGGLSVNRVTLSRSSDWASDGLWSVKATRTADASTDSYIELISCLPGGTNALLPNTTYTIAATYKLDDKFATAPESGSGLNQRLSIFVHLNNTTRGIVTGINKNNQTGRLRLVFTTPASFATAPNTIRLYAGGSPGEYIYWDDWALYEGDVETFDGEGNLFSWTGNANNSSSIRTTYGSWKELSEVSSTTASGILAANKLQPGDYEVQVAAQDADGTWGAWGAPETFALGPATNIKTRSGGAFVDTVRMVRQGGVWVPAAVTKTKQGGTFI